MGFDPVTFLFELVNFLVLVVVLDRLVYRPLRRGIEARRAAQAEQAEQAARKLAESEALRREWEGRLGEQERLRGEVLRAAHEEAAQARARLLETAQEDAQAERARARHLLEAEREAARTWVRDLAVERSADLAGRLLLKLAPEAAHQALLERLVEQAARERPSLPPGELELTFARAPDPAAVSRLREALTGPQGPSPTVREDPALLAGAVARVGHRVLDASVKGQLEAFRGEARRLAEELERDA